MSTQTHDSAPLRGVQEEDLNDANWNEVVKTRLPRNWQEQARTLKAWRRQRGLRSISDLLRALAGVCVLRVLGARARDVGGTQRHRLTV